MPLAFGVDAAAGTASGLEDVPLLVEMGVHDSACEDIAVIASPLVMEEGRSGRSCRVVMAVRLDREEMVSLEVE